MRASQRLTSFALSINQVYLNQGLPAYELVSQRRCGDDVNNVMKDIFPSTSCLMPQGRVDIHRAYPLERNDMIDIGNCRDQNSLFALDPAAALACGYP